jgi:hypothetical protein
MSVCATSAILLTAMLLFSAAGEKRLGQCMTAGLLRERRDRDAAGRIILRRLGETWTTGSTTCRFKRNARLVREWPSRRICTCPATTCKRSNTPPSHCEWRNDPRLNASMGARRRHGRGNRHTSKARIVPSSCSSRRCAQLRVQFRCRFRDGRRVPLTAGGWFSTEPVDKCVHNPGGDCSWPPVGARLGRPAQKPGTGLVALIPQSHQSAPGMPRQPLHRRVAPTARHRAQVAPKKLRHVPRFDKMIDGDLGLSNGFVKSARRPSYWRPVRRSPAKDGPADDKQLFSRAVA